MKSAFMASVVILTMLSLMYFLENYDRYVMAVSVIPYIDYTSYEYSLLSGTVFAICYSGGGVVLSLIGESMNSSSSKSKVMILTLAGTVFSVAFALSAIAKNFYQQVCIRMVMGLSQSLVTPFSTGIIGECFDDSVRGIACSCYQLGVYFSFSMSLSLGTYIYDEYGWKANYLLFGIIGSIFSLFTPLIMPLLPSTSNGLRVLSHGSKSGERSGDYAVISEHDLRTTKILDDMDESCTASSFDKTSDTSTVLNPVSHMEHLDIPQMVENGIASETETDAFSVELSAAEIRQNWTTRAVKILSDIFQLWRKNPSIFMLCIATGVRLGAGYIWSAYTSVFFSELWMIQQGSSSCTYSYDSNSTASESVGASCDVDYPFCVASTDFGASSLHSSNRCCKVSPSAWHNEGMPHIQLEEYMSWVPLAGSAVGNVIGGIVSDKIYQRVGLEGRVLVAGVGNLLAAPLVALAFVVGFPGCFLCMVGSGLVGESYLGQSLAFFICMTPQHLVVASVAVFMFFITIIAGNMPLLVPAVSAMISPRLGDTIISVTAAPTFSAISLGGVGRDQTQVFSVVLPHGGALPLQQSLVYTLISIYLCSFILFLACFFMRQRS